MFYIRQAAQLTGAMAQHMFHTFASSLAPKKTSPYLPILTEIWKQQAKSSGLIDSMNYREHMNIEALARYYWQVLYPSAECKDDLRQNRRPISQIVDPTLRQYCPEMRLFEVGSGTCPVTEFLSEPTPEEIRRVQLSDVSKLCVDSLRAQYPLSNVAFYDILSAPPIGKTYPCIVMTDLLNFFSRDEMEIACRNASKLLDPGGHLIHFAIREGLIEHMLDELKSPETIYFPLINPCNEWIGVYLMDYIEFNHFILSLKPEHRNLKELLSEYSSLDLYQCDRLCLRSSKNEQLHLFRTVSDQIRQLNCPKITQVLFREHSFERIQQAVENSPLQIIRFEEKESRSIRLLGEEPHPKENLLRMLTNKGAFHPTSHSTLPHPRVLEGEVVEERAKVHVLVAQKPQD